MHAIAHVDRGVLALVWVLIARPGTVAKDYVAGRRKRYFGPFAFVVIVVGLATAAMALAGFAAFSSDTPNWIADWLQRHVNVVILLQVPLLAAFCALLFPRQQLYFAEHLVLAAYASGMRSLFLTVFLVPLWTLWQPSHNSGLTLLAVYLCIWFAYFGFAAAQFYAGSRLAAGFKGALAALLTQAATQAVVSAWTRLALA